jgi:ferritin-like metal-binding protein YciE
VDNPVAQIVALDETVLAAATVRQAADELGALWERRDELLRSLAEAGQRLADLRQQVQDTGNLDNLRRELVEARDEVEASRQQAANIRREATEASRVFGEVGQLMAAARADAEAVRGSVAEADAAARHTLEQLRAAVEEARATTPAPAPPAAPPEPADGPGREVPVVSHPAELPRAAGGAPAEVLPVPAAELAADARERLVHYLNDAAAVEKEQAGLLQTLADSTEVPDLRAALEEHVALSRQQQRAVEERVRQLGGESAGGRGLLGQIVTRVWDVLQKPRDGSDGTVEGLLKALSAAEFEAGMYLAVRALARAVGDGETADLAAAHLRHEQDFAGHLRDRITPTAARAARTG